MLAKQTAVCIIDVWNCTEILPRYPLVEQPEPGEVVLGLWDRQMSEGQRAGMLVISTV